MKETYWGYWLILLGIFVIVILMLVQSYTTTNTQDYYLIKEISEAAMNDAVDHNHYIQTSGELRINREMFMESFIRRFVENKNLSNNYKISFYDIYEAPPKVSVKVTSESNTFKIASDTTNFSSTNKITAILGHYPSCEIEE